MSVDVNDLRSLRESISAVLAAECSSLAVHAFIDGKSPLDELLWSQARELGWHGITLPEEYGGFGFGAYGLDLICTELGRCAAPGPYISTLSAAQWLAEVATTADKQRYLPLIARGELEIATPAYMGGPNAPTDQLTEKLQMLGTVRSRMAIAPISHEGGAAFGLFEIHPQASDMTPLWDRTRASFAFSPKNSTPVAVIPDADGRARRRLVQYLTLAIASDSAGGARSIFEQTVEYMKTRVQFGKPIGSFQALKHRASDMLGRLAITDQLMAQAVASTMEDEEDGPMWAALAKSDSTETFAYVAADCVQLHGGVGFTWEFDCHVYLKRARLNEALIDSNGRLRDRAAEMLAIANREGRSTLELAV